MVKRNRVPNLEEIVAAVGWTPMTQLQKTDLRATKKAMIMGDGRLILPSLPCSSISAAARALGTTSTMIKKVLRSAEHSSLDNAHPEMSSQERIRLLGESSMN